MDRPRRRYVRHAHIAAEWGLDDDDRQCMACGDGVDEWNELERCHVVVRHAGGLDGAQNLWLLCRPCHRGCRVRGWQSMPDFLPGQEEAAEIWLATHATWVDGVNAMIRGIQRVTNIPGIDEGTAYAALFGGRARGAEHPYAEHLDG